ncbi:ABC transporter B family member 5 [Tetrabaena socialis]|uniref:ABC transporter B family member 5 n=1 Tax=Tetrabaena socialis TaxID=47790 RepID=A0A2J7ZKW5_9CHLO|nr:ABC transporter B family member 5 [Tetrabaena socialis]|eukprot:PNH00919.1 ABC transporter B family member 5 [Tetrabaena socialis]
MNINFKEVVYTFLGEHKVLTAAHLILALTLTPINDILLPHLYGKLVSAVEKRASPVRPLVYVILALATVQIGSFVRDVLDMYTQPLLFDSIKTRMVDALLTKYDGNIVEPNTGQVVSKVVRAPDIIAWWTSVILEYFIPQLFAFCFALAYFLYYDRYLAASLMFLVIAVIVLLVFSPTRCVQQSVRREQMLDNVHEDVEDVLRNLISVYSNDTSADEVNLLHQSGLRFQKANMLAMSCLLKFKAIGVPIIIAFVAVVVLRCCVLIQSGRLETGTFVSIFMITTSMVGSLMWLVSIIKASTLDIGTIVEAQDLFSKEEQPPPVPLHDPARAPPRPDGIGFHRVTYKHPTSKRPVLTDLTAHFESGERTVITGNIGSGKSTILKLMMAFIQPQKGDIYVTGQWYSQTSPRDVRRKVAYMPQEAILFDRTIAANILYGSPEKSLQDVHDIVDQLGVWKVFQNMTDGLHTMVGKSGSKLSGGQRQLIWFMRIILRDPTIIILDEPTAAMDEATKEVLMQALRVVAHGRTIIMVTHDADLLSFATRHVNLEPASDDA